VAHWFDTLVARDDAWTGHAHAETLSWTKAHVMTRLAARCANRAAACRKLAARCFNTERYRCLVERADELDNLAAHARQFAAREALRAPVSSRN
jgi:hypothetical protein